MSDKNQESEKAKILFIRDLYLTMESENISFQNVFPSVKFKPYIDFTYAKLVYKTLKEAKEEEIDFDPLDIDSYTDEYLYTFDCEYANERLIDLEFVGVDNHRSEYYLIFKTENNNLPNHISIPFEEIKSRKISVSVTKKNK